MAGRIAAFASGSNLVIRMGDLQLAYGTNLSWSDDVAHAAVGGIGSFSYDALEPLQYLARGTFSLVRYSSAVRAKLGDTQKVFGAAPARSTAGSTTSGTDGNSMLRPNNFNPSSLLISRSFDIDVYERQSASSDSTAATGTPAAPIAPSLSPIWKLKDCRMTSYSITFTPGQLVSENIGFICILAGDGLTQDLTTLD